MQSQQNSVYMNEISMANLSDASF